MTADPDFLAAMTEALAQRGGLASFYVLMLVTAISVALGRSLILLANQIKPWRLGISLLVNALKFLVSCAVWITLPYLLGTYFWDADISLAVLVVLVAQAFAPLTAAWLGLLPYFGRGILRLLNFVSFTLLFIFLGLLGFENRLFILLPLGFIFMSVINLLLLNPLQRLAAGRKLVLDFKAFRV